MVDTIVIMLESQSYKICDPDKFLPSARWATDGHQCKLPGIQSKQRSTKKDLRAGIYKPYLLLSQRANLAGIKDTILKIELSLPKLLFGNNFHYSKNIPLTDGSTPYHYIKKIKEANVRLSLDVNQTDYRNDGHSYKWHCNSYEVAFYDKIKDLEIAQESSKRSLKKDNELQLDILDHCKDVSD